MGRTQEFTDASIVAALKKTKGMVYLAADKVGCHPDTIYARAKTSPAIATAIKGERGKVLDLAEQKLFAAIKKGAPWAIQFALRLLGKDRGYVDKPAEDKPASEGQVPVDVVTQILAAIASRRPASVAGAGDGASGSNPVVPQAGAAGGSVPLGSG